MRWWPQEKLDEAVAEYHKAWNSSPTMPKPITAWDSSCIEAGQFREALPQLAEAIRLQPDNASFLGQLAWALATCPEASVRNGAKAVILAQQAVQLTGGKDAKLLDILAAAYAESGRFAEAVATVQRALANASDQNDSVSADALRDRLKLYQAGSPYHQARSDRQATDHGDWQIERENWPHSLTSACDGKK